MPKQQMRCARSATACGTAKRLAHAEDASGSTLAGETVADRDSNRLSLDGESELLTIR